MLHKYRKCFIVATSCKYTLNLSFDGFIRQTFSLRSSSPLLTVGTGNCLSFICNRGAQMTVVYDENSKKILVLRLNLFKSGP